MSHAGISGVSDEKRHGAPPRLGRPGATLPRSPATAATAASSPSAQCVEIGTWRERSQQRPSARRRSQGIVIRAAAALAKAGHAAHDLGRALDDAHQFLAHLAATEPDRTNEPGSDASADTAGTVGKSGSGPRDGRAEAVATSGHFQGHQRAGLRLPVGRNRCPLTRDRAASPVAGRDGATSAACTRWP